MKPGSGVMHHGRQRIAIPQWPVPFWECQRCGARWLCPNLTHAYRWCPLAPAGLDTPLPQHVLSVDITQPDWAAGSIQPFAIGVRVDGVGTTLASVATAERALLVAYALRTTFEKDPQSFRQAW